MWFSKTLIRWIALLIEKWVGILPQLKRLSAAERTTIVRSDVQTVVGFQTDA
ncbi:hypothetical protein CfE428DRAFT_3952 [Chthoniobacter flavus Ellin428]|uniref:Uncharacterized protein n=1 Tax=Chthoniobacter flavus Ellin428 TaxID=497964 RepID=B4D4W4_9BACT|nr:hypothetical protein CfE428DRAFT_3952 [Chthoniobacter flavus Ellin428]TCO90978.1 hypothetical protein EV701_109128 [Chthoniobacter flavus]